MKYIFAVFRCIYYLIKDLVNNGRTKQWFRRLALWRKWGKW